MRGALPALTPLGAMPEDPICQGSLEADIMAGFFRFVPFVPQNLVALGQKLAIERGILHQIFLRIGPLCFVGHNRFSK